MSKPIVIAMAGDSGVGKTTMARMFNIILGPENCTILRGDDLHKYERNDPMWQVYTHLNPAANDLEMGDRHLLDLCNLKPISRKIYNHSTGRFDDPVIINPNKYIIDDGLHALFTEAYRELASIKIYIDAPDDLICHWKINRDTKERGQSIDEVRASISKRAVDSHLFIKPQKDFADVIINFVLNEPIKVIGDKNEQPNFHIEYIIKNDFKFKNLFHHIFSKLQEYTKKINDFSYICRQIGCDPSQTQGPGGNISIKINESLMAVKSSGRLLKDIYHASGFSVMRYDYVSNFYAGQDGKVQESEMMEVLESSTIQGDQRPSMESAVHAILPDGVVHTHPVYLNCIMCSEDSKDICSKIFKDMDYEYVDMCLPGSELTNAIIKLQSEKKIFLIENHGLIVCGDLDFCKNTAAQINNICKNYLIKLNASFVDFENYTNDSVNNDDKFLYADDVMFLNCDKAWASEVRRAHNYIINNISHFSRARFISDEMAFAITNLESEKYRKTQNK